MFDSNPARNAVNDFFCRRTRSVEALSSVPARLPRRGLVVLVDIGDSPTADAAADASHSPRNRHVALHRGRRCVRQPAKSGSYSPPSDVPFGLWTAGTGRCGFLSLLDSHHYRGSPAPCNSLGARADPILATSRKSTMVSAAETATRFSLPRRVLSDYHGGRKRRTMLSAARRRQSLPLRGDSWPLRAVGPSSTDL